MLIICNGAFKSGSSWIHAIVSSIVRARSVPITEVPPFYGISKSPVHLIGENRLVDFIQREDIHSKNYLTKAHFFSIDTLSRRYPNEVVFIFIERDLRDAVVSHYYHFKAKVGFDIGFALYYWSIGRYKAYEIALFNKRCHKYWSDTNFFNYERMKADTASAVQQLCQLLGLAPLSDSELRSIVQETSLESMRRRAEVDGPLYYQDTGHSHAKMYRKGAVGDYASHFTLASLQDIKAIAELKLSMVGRALFSIMFVWRRALRHKILAKRYGA